MNHLKKVEELLGIESIHARTAYRDENGNLKEDESCCGKSGRLANTNQEIDCRTCIGIILWERWCKEIGRRS